MNDDMTTNEGLGVESSEDNGPFIPTDVSHLVSLLARAKEVIEDRKYDWGTRRRVRRATLPPLDRPGVDFVVGGDRACDHEWDWEGSTIRKGCVCMSCLSYPCRRCDARFEM